MAKIKCGNCGLNMLEARQKNGILVYLCPKIKPNKVRKISNILAYPEVWCGSPTSETPSVYSERPEAIKFAKAEALETSFKELTKNSKLTTEKLQRATYHTIDIAKLHQYTNIAIMLDLPVDQLPELFQSAIKLGFAMGASPKYAIESLTKGIGRESKKILDNIGVTFKGREAIEWYKREHSLKTLTGEQHKLAWRQFACKVVIEKAKPLIVTKEQVKLAQLQATRENGAVAYGKELLKGE